MPAMMPPPRSLASACQAIWSSRRLDHRLCKPEIMPMARITSALRIVAVTLLWAEIAA